MERVMSVRRLFAVVLAVSVLIGAPAFGLDSFIKMKNGYFCDSVTGQPWVPHGIAYQTWNRPLGVWQTFDQIDYDLDEMVKMGANSIRVDFVWQHIEEDGDNQWKWANYDYLVQACEKRNIRIFALIGYQWPPNWFPDAWYTMHPPEIDAEGIEHTNRWQSDIINYEHPQARAQYAEWISTVCGRYKNAKAIAGWIVGNESGYLGLWSGLLDGYDPQSEQAFRNWAQAKYTTIAAANAVWGTAFTNFNQLTFPDQYRAYGVEGAIWADAVQWREDSIASFTALGAKAAKTADTNHLISYSTVGMQWGEEDWRYHAEDRGKITAYCLATNAPIDFFSVNNYPWSILGHESQNGHWGVSYTKKVAKVPVLYSETGFTSSETMWPGMNELRQGPLVRNALWESLEVGAIGTHIFSWMDRPYITDREKGFGIVYANRGIKPAYWVSRNAFNLMEQVKLHELLAGSQDPKPDIAFLWTAANDSQYNRYECEMQQIAGALERLGYEPNFLDLNDLGSGAYTNYKVIILPRNMRVESVVPNSGGKGVLEFLRTAAIPKGIHIMATGDLPGMQDPNGRPQTNFVDQVKALFGVDPSDIGGYEVPQRRREYVSWYWEPVLVRFTTNAIGPVAGGYTYKPYTWKYSDETVVNGGVVWAEQDSQRNKGFEDSNTSLVRWDGTWGNVVVRNNWGWQYDGVNMVQMWGDSGMWQDFPVLPFGRYTASAYLRSNSDDPLREGRQAYVAIEWYNEKGVKVGVSESARLSTNTPGNAWVRYAVDALAPSNAWTGRRVIRTSAGAAGAGSVYVDNKRWAPAVVVKNHGAGKAAIFLYGAGDNMPDGNEDGEPDVLMWQHRYNVFGAMVRDYFGVQPAIKATGTNAYLCLPEYRICTNGAVLVQLKNYLYDTNQPHGGAPMTFTIQSSLLNGKTVRAFEQAKVIETNSDGIVNVTLAPDGQEMLYAYTPGAGKVEVVQILDAPALVHPMGDKVYEIKVGYDCQATPNLRLKAAFMEDGNNGDAIANEIYQVLTNAVSGAGQTTFYMWIPDPNQADSDYKSTPDGGKYKFAAWLETTGGVKVAEAVPMPTQLKWGVNPTTAVATNVNKGATLAMPFEWEDLYEPLWWQNTPLTRNSAYPGRVAVYRSSKTEAQFPGHYAKVNEVCNWLESMGYSSGNPLDILFDNVTVSGLFTDTFESGSLANWTRAAGCANWAVADNPAPATNGTTVAYWKNDETLWNGTSNEVKDASGKLNHGRAVNGAVTVTDARRGRAGLFDGTNDYVEIPNSATLQVNGSLTLSFWIKGANLGKARFNPLDKSYGGEFGLTIETNRALSFYQGSQRVSGKYIGWTALPAGSLVNGAWQHVVITRDAATRTLKSYLNGALVATTTYANDTNTLPVKTTYPVRLGVGYTGAAMGGNLDEVRIANNVYDAGAVWQEYVATGGAKGLRAWRIGNDDNIMTAGTATWSNRTVSADIRYNKQDCYFSDAELYVRYVDRNNYYKVGIRNFYGFWRLKYTVKVGGVIHQQGWLYEFPKTNRPVENTWYNLKVESYGSTNKVFFNGQPAGVFWATNFPTGKIALGSRATQLGIWEPQKGYFFIDDDEYGMTGAPLNMDWGYLVQFYPVVVLPSVYVMNDKEASNLVTWAKSGLFGLLATDGGVAMKNETGADDLGRVESLFGVPNLVTNLPAVSRVFIGNAGHYATLDYAAGASIAASGAAKVYPVVNRGVGLGTTTNGAVRPALIVNTLTNNPNAPTKAFCFNFGVDTGNQLTGAFSSIARRAFEWVQGFAYKARVELKYSVDAANPGQDILIYATNVWVLKGSGTNALSIQLPADGIMTGDKAYWVIYAYPWDATNAWLSHAGFFTSGNDNRYTTINGQGLQILGITEKAFAGRAWDMWAVYNTQGQTNTVVFGVKDKGAVNVEDNFDAGNTNGWTVIPHANIRWSMTNGAVRAAVISTGGYAYIVNNSLRAGVTNITIEYDVKFDGNAYEGGVVYRGRVLYVNPNMCGWADTNAYYYSGVGATGRWHSIVLHIRDGAPHMRSDLYVDGYARFLNEPIEVAGYTTNTVGFLSPYTRGSWDLDNVRIADEQYTFATETRSGILLPTNGAPAFWPYVPDYDPMRWEHDGTSYGAEYQWYVYLKGAGVHAYQTAKIYFAPRLRVEATNFPTTLERGTSVQVPVEWEALDGLVPARLYIVLQEALYGTEYVNTSFPITSVSGSGAYKVNIPAVISAGSTYQWLAYIAPTNATSPWNQRIGSDDTYRHNPYTAYGPETRITVLPPPTNSDYVIYNDDGIKAGLLVYTWWASNYWGFIDATHNDGGFEQDLVGFFPTGGQWRALNAGGGCGTIVNPESARTGAKGVWSYTGNETWANWVASYSQFGAFDGDIFRAEAYVRQPTGTYGTWVAGSAAFIRMKFMDAASNTLTYVDSATKVTAEDQAWTLCSIPDTTAPFGTKYIRLELMVTKPTVAGVSVACFDDCQLLIGNSFNGNFMSDPNTPEGSKCFRSYVVDYSGWGVFATNTAGVNLSAYTNGVLKFWLKSSGYTKVEIKDKAGVVKLGASYGPTTNTSGVVVWTEKTIPASAFAGANFSQLESPFMVTDPTYDRAFYVDNVRWQKTP